MAGTTDESDNLRRRLWVDVLTVVGLIIIGALIVGGIVYIVTNQRNHRQLRTEQHDKMDTERVQLIRDTADLKARLDHSFEEIRKLDSKYETALVWIGSNDRRMERLLTAIEHMQPDGLEELRATVIKEIREEIYQEREEREKEKEN